MIKEQLGNRIYQLRKIHNITQEELAEKLDISQRALSKIETGANFIKSSTLDKLLKVFNMTTSEFFDIDHLAPNEDLLESIYNNIEILKMNETDLRTLYIVTEALTKK